MGNVISFHTPSSRARKKDAQGASLGDRTKRKIRNNRNFDSGSGSYKTYYDQRKELTKYNRWPILGQWACKEGSHLTKIAFGSKSITDLYCFNLDNGHQYPHLLLGISN